jgi:hypothetical protein
MRNASKTFIKLSIRRCCGTLFCSGRFFFANVQVGLDLLIPAPSSFEVASSRVITKILRPDPGKKETSVDRLGQLPHDDVAHAA